MYVCMYVWSKMESVWQGEGMGRREGAMGGQNGESMGGQNGGKYGGEEGAVVWWGEGIEYGGREKGEGVHVCLAHVNGLDGYPPDCTCMLSLRLDLHMFLLSSVLKPPACTCILKPPACTCILKPPACTCILKPPACTCILKPPACTCIL